MTDLVLQTVPLGDQWPTIDPFLFCAHHNDNFPAGNPDMGPSESLDGRTIGMDFDNINGWNMYHGSVVPGFPQHPHRGFETVTIVRKGLIDHSDSMGAAARFGRGDVQWLTAGRGVVHSEMFPLLDETAPNPTELFQIWLNLPSTDKLTDPYFTMIWDRDIPRVTHVDTSGRTTEIAVVAGALGDVTVPKPPPNSWAARAEADVAIWLIRMEPGAQYLLPAATGPDTVRTLYCFEGSELTIGTAAVGPHTGAALDAHQDAPLTAGVEPVECLILQGRPIGEPVERYGPFVMNTREELEQAFSDYRETQFGGWPWPSDDPVHDRNTERFARHVDGRVESASNEHRAAHRVGERPDEQSVLGSGT